jgi:hypothetical protein
MIDLGRFDDGFCACEAANELASRANDSPIAEQTTHSESRASHGRAAGRCLILINHYRGPFLNDGLFIHYAGASAHGGERTLWQPGKVKVYRSR